MKTSINEIKLPSDRKFGFFFSFIFLIISTYLYINKFNITFLIFSFVSIIFFIIAFIKPEILKPLNKLWMKFGMLLGIIISPLVMGLIFFFIFTPTGLIMKLFGRDELLLRLNKKSSYWINQNENGDKSNSFMNQF
tara:strand:- start:2217 stop:2624 length:408 start_codon:yes stop_codon:yes gene_type:complete